MTIEAPSNVSYGRISYDLLSVIRDDEDPDQIPEFVAPTGTITAVASVSVWRDPTATPRPLSIAPDVFVGEMIEGRLSTMGPAGEVLYPDLVVPANDDPDLNPTGTTYTITYSLRGPSGQRLDLKSHKIVVIADQTTDLTLVGPVDNADQIGIPQAEAAAAAAALSSQQSREAADAAAADASASRTASDESAASAATAAAAVGSKQSIETLSPDVAAHLTDGSELDVAVVAKIEDVGGGIFGPLAKMPDGGAKAVGEGELAINVADFASVQAALDAAPDGCRILFPGGTYAVPTGGYLLKSNNCTIDAMGAHFTVSAWGTPVFLGLRSNGGSDGNTYLIGFAEYVGVRGTHTGSLVRGSAPYCSGSAVWTNGDRNLVEYCKTDGMPTPINFSSWDGASAVDRTGVGNRIGYLEATRYNFGLLYVMQEGFDWGDAYCHDDLDDSSGTNATHAIYCSAANNFRAGAGVIGKWFTKNNLSGHAYIFKYQDKLTAPTLVAANSRGVVNFQDCDDLTVDSIVGTAMTAPPSNAGSVMFQFATAPSQRASIGKIKLTQAAGNENPAVQVWADDSHVGSIEIVDNRAVASGSIGTTIIRGSRSSIHSLRVRQQGAATKAAAIGQGLTDTTDCSVEDIVFPGDAVPVLLFANSLGCRWNRKTSQFAAGAAPTTGTWLRGDFARNQAPSANVPLGWVCITGGTPGTWLPVGIVGTNVTAASTSLESITHPVNTTDKLLGKQVYNTTTGKTVAASGTTAGSVWKDATGATAHTPI